LEEKGRRRALGALHAWALVHLACRRRWWWRRGRRRF